MKKFDENGQPRWLYVFPVLLGLLAIATLVLLIVFA